MTREKLQFILPVVFTVGPEDNLESLLKYITLLADSDRGEHAGDHVAQIVTGVVEGETRVLASSMTIEEIFTERDQFKKAISKGIQSELDQFGLHIYNANIKELKDAPGTVRCSEGYLLLACRHIRSSRILWKQEKKQTKASVMGSSRSITSRMRSGSIRRQH